MKVLLVRVPKTTFYLWTMICLLNITGQFHKVQIIFNFEVFDTFCGYFPIFLSFHSITTFYKVLKTFKKIAQIDPAVLKFMYN